MTELKEKKTRQRLTTTALVEALDEMYRATLTESQQAACDACAVHLRKQINDTGVVYYARLFARDNVGEEDEIDYAKSATDFDDALFLLLEKMQKRLEGHRRILLSSLEEVMAKHRGVLKGARSKIREKKA